MFCGHTGNKLEINLKIQPGIAKYWELSNTLKENYELKKLFQRELENIFH